MNQKPLILAIDTSCDDTSAAVMRGETILSNVIASQTELHRPYGGVFPTIAKQAHKENIEPTMKLALKRAKVSLEEIEALAVTTGPGLAPALEVGINFVKQLAKKTNKPLIAVNHIEGHALSALAKRNKKNTDGVGLKKISNHQESKIKNKQSIKKSSLNQQKIKFPVLSIVVSGGHTQFILIDKIGSYKIIGSTIDDAAGECLDKIGRMLNLGYPAGSTIEKFAKLGNPKAVVFPLPMTTIKTFDMSFSGLKTFTRNYIEDTYGKASLSKQQVYDLCASAQYGVFRHIIYKLSKILYEYNIAEIWLGGGVASNTQLRKMIRQTIKKVEQNNQQNNPKEALENTGTNSSSGIKFRVPFTNRLCMDNAAMIGLVAAYKFGRKEFEKNPEQLDRKPRWKVS